MSFCNYRRGNFYLCLVILLLFFYSFVFSSSHYENRFRSKFINKSVGNYNSHSISELCFQHRRISEHEKQNRLNNLENPERKFGTEKNEMLAFHNLFPLKRDFKNPVDLEIRDENKKVRQQVLLKSTTQEDKEINKDHQSMKINSDNMKTAANMALCKNCKKYFDRDANYDRACVYHPKPYSGDSARKADWSNAKGRGSVVKMYWCCGETDINHKGCKYDRHRSYDD